jgi:GAF domain-containing protein
MLAYLVIREGSKWTDVFRLMPGQSVTIGRAPTNQIVVKDERCSRAHAEVFYSQERWVLRDLESRNGTLVGSERVRGDYLLQPGEIIRIGHSQMAFVHDLASAFPDTSSDVLRGTAKPDDTLLSASVDDADVLSESDSSPTKITHRRGQTRFLTPEDGDDEAIPKVGRAAAQLCRLAFEMAKAPDMGSVARVALAGLFESMPVDAGAVLLTPRFMKAEPDAGDLEVVASRTDSELNYQRVSAFVAATVLREGEAVLGRNVMGDSALSIRDSKGEFHATGILCAPIRKNDRMLGVIHLYSTRPERMPDPEDLEFTLAVADTLAVALENLSRRLELAEDLKYSATSPAPRPTARPCSSAGKAVSARNWSPVRSISPARERKARSASSIVRPYPRVCSKASFSATSAGHSPAQPSAKWANSKQPTAAR